MAVSWKLSGRLSTPPSASVPAPSRTATTQRRVPPLGNLQDSPEAASHETSAAKVTVPVGFLVEVGLPSVKLAGLD